MLLGSYRNGGKLGMLMQDQEFEVSAGYKQPILRQKQFFQKSIMKTISGDDVFQNIQCVIYSELFFKNFSIGAGELTQRELADLAREQDQGSVPSTNMVTPVPQDPILSSDLLGIRYSCGMWCTHTRGGITLIQINSSKKFFFKIIK